MKYEDIETQEDKIDYYEGLLDFLDDHLPNLEDLVALYEDEQE